MTPSTNTDRVELIDQLSAYLDGELDDASRRRIEQLLADDAEARSLLRQLKQAGEWLDDLPRREAQPSFTETTVSMVAIAEEQLVNVETSSTRRPWLRWLVGGLCLLLSLACGFALMAALRPRPNDLLLDNLAVIENLDAYREADSVEFLKQLHKRGFFKDIDAPPLSDIPDDDARQRRAAVQKMTDADKEQLLAKLERFKHLDSAEQRRLHDLRDAIDDADNSDELQETMRRYHAWLTGLQAVQRAELLAMPAPRRLARLEELQTMADRQKKRRLSDADAKVVADWLDQTLLRLPPGERQRMLSRMLSQRGQPLDAGRPAMFNEFLQLRERLSPQAREQLTSAVSPIERQELLAMWVRQGMMALAERYGQAAGQDASPERLRRFFDEDVPESERERLLSLPSEEMQSELRRLYQLRSIFPGLQGKGPGQGARQGAPSRNRPMNPKAP